MPTTIDHTCAQATYDKTLAAIRGRHIFARYLWCASRPEHHSKLCLAPGSEQLGATEATLRSFIKIMSGPGGLVKVLSSMFCWAQMATS